MKKEKKKNNEKKTKELTGCMGHKLARGKGAVIKCIDGVSYYTSDVVDIRNVTANGVEIETQNTIYKLNFPTSNTLSEAV